MKFSKKRNQYEASNVTFSQANCEAYSYNWWKFVTVIDGLVIFNNYNYSPSTNKHQAKVRRLMSELGIKIDLVVSTRESLDYSDKALESAIEGLKKDIAGLVEILGNNRRKRALDEERQGMIARKCNEIYQISKVLTGNSLAAALN